MFHSRTARSRISRLCATLALVGLSAGATAQIASGPFTFELRTVATGLAAPVSIKAAPDGTGRLFVVDQPGRVRIIDAAGNLLPTPFLDLTGIVSPLSAGYDEKGLLDIEFHPNYAANGRFFVRYSRQRTGVAGEPCFNTSRGCHTEVLAEYRVGQSSPNIADATSGVVLFTVDKPQFNHNGGAIAFGPDGFLYMPMGDGGGANDGLADNPPSHGPAGNAQNLTTSMGKLLRFDVSTPGALAFPPSNPFLATPGAYGGIYAYGLRNPFGFSFDNLGTGATNTLIFPDVGQNLFEEINLVTAPGQNFGWPIREAAHCFDPFSPNAVPPGPCNTVGLSDPILEYPHADVSGPVGIAIIAGAVYRGTALPGLTGQYLFGDFSSAFGSADGHLFHADVLASTPGPILRPRLGATNRNLAAFLKGMGRDAQGEIYLLTSTTLGPAGTNGRVQKIVPCPADFNGSATLSVQDIFDFLSGYFTNDLRADVNNSGTITVQDIFDFLGFYFSGC